MNWKELKDFCNTLDENQLEKNVIIWREDEVVNNVSPLLLEEDYYRGDESSDKCFSESEAKDIADDPDEFPNGIKDMIKCYDKGHPFLLENF